MVPLLKLIVKESRAQYTGRVQSVSSCGMTAILATNLESMVSFGNEEWRTQLVDTIGGFTARGDVTFAQDVENTFVAAVVDQAMSYNPISSTLVFPFMLLNTLYAFVIVPFQYLILPQIVPVKDGPGSGHRVLWSLLSPTVGCLVFVLTMTFSHNYYNLVLWIPLAILLWLGNIALHLDASRIGREVLWSQDELAISKKSQEQADSVLNHVLKNIMVDVSNCIEMHKEGNAPDDMLEEAEALLFRGKWWCRMREAILNIAAGRYEGGTAVVDLVEFGRDLCKGRPDVNLSFQGARRIVHLDALVCSIILDNAISNAIRHCSPDDPSVQLEIAVQEDDIAMESDETPVRVQFLTTNYTDSRKGRIERWNGTGPIVISDRPQQEHAPMSMSDGIGLKHVVMAAGKYNIDVELWQEDDCVFFKATYPTTVASRQSSDCAFTNDQNDAQTLPSGLQIACIDDSKVARIGLHGALSRLIDQSTVTVFGSSLEEVDQFKQQVMEGCHIAILDQNIDLPGKNVFGTDLIKELRSKGCTAMLCIRSGNVSQADQELYFRSGANSVFDKELTFKELALELGREYAQYSQELGQHQMPRASTASLMSV
jgi:CheY-like chemotaxis protein